MRQRIVENRTWVVERSGTVGTYAAMPRFYFHLIEEGDRIEDEEGIELLDLEAAREVAIKNARTIIAHEVIERGVVPLEHVIEIADRAGRVAGTVAFRDTIALRSFAAS